MLATRNNLMVAILVIGLAIAGIVGYLSMALSEAIQAARQLQADKPSA